MSKITFIGAGSTVFAKNVLGDCMRTPALQGFELALYDIDLQRLKDSENMLSNIKASSGSTCIVKSYTDRKEALRGAKYVINAIQVGGTILVPLQTLKFRRNMAYVRRLRTRLVSVAFSATYVRFLSCLILPQK